MTTTHTASAATVLDAALQVAGVVTQPGAGGLWPSYIGHMPDGPNEPDNLVSVRDTVGTTNGRIMRTGKTVEHPGFQIKVRALGFTAGMAQAIIIADVLDKLRNEQVAVDGKWYKIAAATRKGTILPIGQEPDKKRRDAFTINGIVTIDPIVD